MSIADTYLGAEASYRAAAAKVPPTQPMRRACYIAEANYYHALAMQLNISSHGPDPIDPSASAACQAMAKETVTTASAGGGTINSFSGPATSTNGSAAGAVLSAISPSADDMPATALAQGIIDQSGGRLSAGTSNTIAAIGLAGDALSALTKLFQSSKYGYSNLTDNQYEEYSKRADADFDRIEAELTKLRDADVTEHLYVIEEAARAVAAQTVANSTSNLSTPPPSGQPQTYDLVSRARAGDAKSAYLLGTDYLYGTGRVIDKLNAYAWLRFAAVRGYSDAITASVKLRTTLSSAQIAKAMTIYNEIESHGR